MLGEYNFSDSIVSDEEMQIHLLPIWSELLAITLESSMAPLVRPPPECDKRKDMWSNPTITHPAPVLASFSTLGPPPTTMQPRFTRHAERMANRPSVL